MMNDRTFDEDRPRKDEPADIPGGSDPGRARESRDGEPDNPNLARLLAMVEEGQVLDVEFTNQGQYCRLPVELEWRADVRDAITRVERLLTLPGSRYAGVDSDNGDDEDIVSVVPLPGGVHSIFEVVRHTHFHPTASRCVMLTCDFCGRRLLGRLAQASPADVAGLVCHECVESKLQFFQNPFLFEE